MKFWVSKYAIKSGLIESEGRLTASPKYARLNGSTLTMKIGRDVHLTRAEAEVAADKLRKKRIALLERQIETLKERKF